MYHGRANARRALGGGRGDRQPRFARAFAQYFKPAFGTRQTRLRENRLVQGHQTILDAQRLGVIAL